MEIVTLESSAYKELIGRIERISSYIEKQEKQKEEQSKETNVWLTTRQVMAMLNVSQRTLQRMRDAGRIAYSVVGHNCRYHLKEVERFVREGLIIGNPEKLEEFKHNYKARMNGKSRNHETDK
ncbi:helix-turn-helix domain-containing protein [Barnesiella intestinihominis]|uniref:helix-turn-helix domain-containing protein n=1 Tax=Barnesiella intestinihominis TaxID=487174 RepID=UPI0018970F63|nr:helix-turn-helix domain-containing protein [Barnesiella intestinihominis]MDB0680547.1 helix-turn-helix domain-containing protein [Barnesiella intestinihominis]